MDRYRRRLKAFVWVTLLAFAGLAVAPTISRAIHLGGDAGEWAAGSGHEQMAAMAMEPGPQHHDASGQEPAPHPPGHSHSLDHCGMCVVAAVAFALASAPPALAEPPLAHEEAVASTGLAPDLRDNWSPATSRGPPLRV